MNVDYLKAASPTQNSIVAASAGVGKTYLLVTRIVRLLLAGVKPDSILAITFTRKAATEMQTRLSERLFEYVTASDETLRNKLQAIDVHATDEIIANARNLYETLLFAETPVRASTFHAFCQDILKKFPLEANVPPGFELVEKTGSLENTARDALYTEATLNADSTIAKALEHLFKSCDGLSNASQALNEFLSQRSDWWAFTRTQEKPVSFAIEKLQQALQVDLKTNPITDFFSANNITTLQEFRDILLLHATKTNLKYAHVIEQVVLSSYAIDDLMRLKSVFLTATNQALKTRKQSATQEKKMGAIKQARFIEIHQLMCDLLIATLDTIAKQKSLARNSDWYLVGNALIQHYQRIKQEQRLLDFSDLEWKAFELLNHSENAHWVQYKMDQRIDHLLVDEFQDTNPTQWRLLLPIMNELAQSTETLRSTFIVGDQKQSIYSFRRADPRLIETAKEWTMHNAAGKNYPMDTSWRSAKVIMDFTNRIFANAVEDNLFTQFHEHTTHHTRLYGKITLFPLIEAKEKETPSEQTLFRNPLHEPRNTTSDDKYLREGLLIAETISTLIQNKTLIGHAHNAQSIAYRDIMLLVRSRKNLHDYEHALRQKNIPYVSANKGTLLSCLEIQDMLSLLTLLITPFDNLALASVLRSPIFSCTNDDLIFVSQQTGKNWWEKLQTISEHQSGSADLQRAIELLNHWRFLNGQLPTHDLLDQIFFQGDILNRYTNNSPNHLKNRVNNNLQKFLSLALETDSGRYPSISRFLSKLAEFSQSDNDAPDEASESEASNAVRIMTIHASKGLESPVVFIADCANKKTDKTAYRVLVDWPPNSAIPAHFFLVPKKDQTDSFSRYQLEKKAGRDKKEDANLLYVAITRAKQYLYMSGCRSAKTRDLGWYGKMWEVLPTIDTCDSQKNHDKAGDDNGKHPIQQIQEMESGDLATEEKTSSEQTQATNTETSPRPKKYPSLLTPEAALMRTQKIENQNDNRSDFNKKIRNNPTERGVQKGIAIHLVFEKFGKTRERNRDLLRADIANRLDIPLRVELFDAWINEAFACINDNQFNFLFDDTLYEKALNEVPIMMYNNKKNQQENTENTTGSITHGIIDRVIINQCTIILLDYKTHPVSEQDSLHDLTTTYRPQMQAYTQAAQLLWPQYDIQSMLLFTHAKQLVEL